MKAPRGIGLILGLAWSPLTAAAQQPSVPIRPLGPILRVTAESFIAVSGIRVLSDGRVLVNDTRGKRVVLFDSTLQHATDVVDTTSGTNKAYGSGGGALVAFYGDSSLFIDRSSTSMLVLDPRGKIVRVIAIPGPASLNLYFTSGIFHLVFDGAGHFLFERSGANGIALASLQPGEQRIGASDSSAIVRVDLATRMVDTVGRLKVTQWTMVRRTENGESTSPLRDPIQPADSWALLPDGTVALVRVFDYHVDWISRGGVHTASPKIQHTWVRITDSAKLAIMDSAKRADSVNQAAARAAQAKRDSVARAAGGTPPTPAAPGAGPPPPVFAEPSDLPDYWPPFSSSIGVGGPVAVMADADGRLWIGDAQRGPTDGGRVYDIVNREGALVDRVQIPKSMSIEGFGPGVVYLSSREGAGTVVARARIR